MAIKDCCSTEVITCDADASVPEVANLMRTHHVGDVIVVEDRAGKRMPLGIVTDRDLVLEGIAVGLDVKVFTAGDLMTSPLVTVDADEGIFETLRVMSKHQVRRIGVTGASGALHGVVCADDLINLLVKELAALSSALVEQPMKESSVRK